MKKILLAVVASSLLAGCAGSSALSKQVAYTLGEEPSDVKVTNIGHGVYETTFNATVRGKKYNCTAMGGNFMTFGAAVQPKCVALKRR